MPRSGGRNESAANRITLCSRCHRWVHAHPAEAMEYGWTVRRGADPADVRINHWLWPAYPVWLEPDGGIRLLAETEKDADLTE